MRTAVAKIVRSLTEQGLRTFPVPLSRHPEASAKGSRLFAGPLHRSFDMNVELEIHPMLDQFSFVVGWSPTGCQRAWLQSPCSSLHEASSKDATSAPLYKAQLGQLWQPVQKYWMQDVMAQHLDRVAAAMATDADRVSSILNAWHESPPGEEFIRPFVDDALHHIRVHAIPFVQQACSRLA